jgi:hypothetical protein
MTSALTAKTWLEAFADHLARAEKIDGRVSHIAIFENGFEDWLKFEMAALLQREPWKYQPWIDGQRGDVGVEYSAALKGAGSKDVDVWASPTPRATRWLFAELKVVFDNSNAGKQFRSWRSDMLALLNIDGRKALQRVEAVASVAFAVGFAAEDVSRWTAKVLGEVRPELNVAWRREVPLASGRLLTMVALIDGE